MSALGVVGPAGDSPRADRARTSGAERAARAHAQDAQGRDRAAATAHARRSAAAVRLVPAALQHRAATRSARPAPARAPVPRVAASLPTTLLPITYPGHYEVRRVSRNGGIRWGSRWV